MYLQTNISITFWKQYFYFKKFMHVSWANLSSFKYLVKQNLYISSTNGLLGVSLSIHKYLSQTKYVFVRRFLDTKWLLVLFLENTIYTNSALLYLNLKFVYKQFFKNSSIKIQMIFTYVVYVISFNKVFKNHETYNYDLIGTAGQAYILRLMFAKEL